MSEPELKALRAELRSEFATKRELEEVRGVALKAQVALEAALIRLDNIAKSLDKVEGHLTWFVRLVLGILIGAVIALVLK